MVVVVVVRVTALVLSSGGAVAFGGVEGVRSQFVVALTRRTRKALQ